MGYLALQVLVLICGIILDFSVQQGYIKKYVYFIPDILWKMKDIILLHNKGKGWRLLAGVADGDCQLHVAWAAVDAATHPAHEVAHTQLRPRRPAVGARLRRGLGHL